TLDPDDLVQDTLVRAYEKIGQLDPERSCRAWLVTVLRNLFLDYCRSESARPRSHPLDEKSLVIAEPDPSPQPPWHDSTPEQVGHAMAQLEEKLRVPFELFEYGGKSYEEIAAILNIPIGSVGTRLRTARQELRELLTPPGKVEEK